MKSIAKKVMVIFATALVITIFPSNPTNVTVHAEDVKPTVEIDGSTLAVDSFEAKQERIKARQIELEKEKEEKEKEPELIGVYEITAYCPCNKCCPGYADGITASGTKAKEGRTVAINNVPLGTVVMFDGKEYVNEDHGGGLGNTVVDLYMDSHQAALNYGRHKNVKVYKIKDAE